MMDGIVGLGVITVILEEAAAHSWLVLLTQILSLDPELNLRNGV